MQETVHRRSLKSLGLLGMAWLWKVSDLWQQSEKFSTGIEAFFMMSGTCFHVDWVRLRYHSFIEGCLFGSWDPIRTREEKNLGSVGEAGVTCTLGLPCQSWVVLLTKLRSSCVRGYMLPSGPTSGDALPAHLSAAPLKVHAGWRSVVSPCSFLCSPFWSVQVSFICITPSLFPCQYTLSCQVGKISVPRDPSFHNDEHDVWLDLVIRM